MGLSLDNGEVGSIKPLDICCVFEFDNNDIEEPLDIGSLVGIEKNKVIFSQPINIGELL